MVGIFFCGGIHTTTSTPIQCATPWNYVHSINYASIKKCNFFLIVFSYFLVCCDEISDRKYWSIIWFGHRALGEGSWMTLSWGVRAGSCCDRAQGRDYTGSRLQGCTHQWPVSSGLCVSDPMSPKRHSLPKECHQIEHSNTWDCGDISDSNQQEFFWVSIVMATETLTYFEEKGPWEDVPVPVIRTSG